MDKQAAWVVLVGCMACGSRAFASEPFPQVIRDEWQVGALGVTGSGCLLCHLTDPGLPGNIQQKFGLTVKNDYEVPLRNTAALKSALRKMRTDGSDSDGDGITDYDELVKGSNVNVIDTPPTTAPDPGQGGSGEGIGGNPAVPTEPGAPTPGTALPVPETGCQLSRASSGGSSFLLAFALAALSSSLRRRRRRPVGSHPLESARARLVSS